MKPGRVTKFDKGNKTESKKIDDDVMPKNYDFVVNFLIYGQFGTIWKPDSGDIVYKFYIFIKSNLLSYKN